MSSPAPCYPSRVLPSCKHCSRRHDDALPPDHRKVAIDAAMHARDGICGMFRLQPAAPALTKVHEEV
jgi:hypothetical protein